jgi:hypothetical protein
MSKLVAMALFDQPTLPIAILLGCWGFLWLFETHGGIRVQENSEFATALKKTCEEKEKALIRHITGGIESSNGHNQQLFATRELHH